MARAPVARGIHLSGPTSSRGRGLAARRAVGARPRGRPRRARSGEERDEETYGIAFGSLDVFGGTKDGAPHARRRARHSYSRPPTGLALTGAEPGCSPMRVAARSVHPGPERCCARAAWSPPLAGGPAAAGRLCSPDGAAALTAPSPERREIRADAILVPARTPLRELTRKRWNTEAWDTGTPPRWSLGTPEIGIRDYKMRAPRIPGRTDAARGVSAENERFLAGLLLLHPRRGKPSRWAARGTRSSPRS